MQKHIGNFLKYDVSEVTFYIFAYKSYFVLILFKLSLGLYINFVK